MSGHKTNAGVAAKKKTHPQPTIHRLEAAFGAADDLPAQPEIGSVVIEQTMNHGAWSRL